MICGFTKDQYKLDHCYNENENNNESISRRCSQMNIKWMADEWKWNCDFPGNDLSQILHINMSECGNFCDIERECTHYTWDNSNNVGKCSLKQVE